MIEVWIEDIDYMRILEEGNFINFVVMVLHKPEKLSVVKTSGLRLKASSLDFTYQFNCTYMTLLSGKNS